MRTELGTIFRLALPATLAMLAAMGMGVFDIVMVNPLGKGEVSAVSLGHVWAITGGVLAMGVARALDPVVSQAWGARDLRTAGLALARNALLLVPTAIVGMIWYRLAPVGLHLLGEPEADIPRAAEYARALSWSLLPTMIFQLLRQYLASCGVMRPTTVAMVTGLCVKIPLNVVFIARMGGPGAAVATSITETTMSVLLVAMTWRTFREAWPERGAKLLVWPELRRLAGLGLSLGLQMGTELWAFAGITMMAGWIGETALAAHTTVINLLSVVFMLPLGISMAASTRVGNLVGEQREWGVAARAAYALGAVNGAVVILLFLLVPGPLVDLYNVASDVRPIAVACVFVGACMHTFDATQVITFGVLRGAGDVRVPTLANVLGYYLIGLPLAYLLGVVHHEGTPGLWWGLVAGQMAVVAVLGVRLRWTARRGGFHVAAV